MNPQYLRISEGIELLAFYVFGPVIAIVIVYSAWRRNLKTLNTKRYGIASAISGIAAVLLLFCAKSVNAGVRESLYYFQFACVMLSLLVLGVGTGCFGVLILRMWFWHKATRLKSGNEIEQ